jgi:hypothetical protein
MTMRKILEFELRTDQGTFRAQKREGRNHTYLLITPKDEKILLGDEQFESLVKGFNVLLEKK